MLVNGNFGTVSSERNQQKNVMFKRFFPRKSAPLRGAAATPRLKTYTAESGYVFHYFYQGDRPSHAPADTGTEFVFQISQDLRGWRPLAVFLSDAALLSWQQAHARELSSTERYALVKMALFQTFDRSAAPAVLRDSVRVDASDATALLQKLRVE
jgi:hypothetical protein